MSTTEAELVSGTIDGITQKKADTWTIQVKREGSEYARNLWTNDAELVQSISAKIGQEGAFVGSLGAPYTVNGKEVRSWWIKDTADATTADAQTAGTRTTPAAAPKDGLSKEEWRRKDIAADKRAYTAIASSALQHTMPSDPTTEDLNTFMSRVAHLTIAWMKVQNALRDGDDVPFDQPLSEHDAGIPF